jgi:hypothetical protein
MTRNGKIARLPQSVREQVNRRLDNGLEGKQIVEWLNSLPEVTALMDAEFDGQPVNEPNLSNWKSGGYLDWQAQQEALEATRQLGSDAVELEDTNGTNYTEQLALCLAARLAIALRNLNALRDDPEAQLKLLRELCLRLAALRKGDHSAQWLLLKRDKFDLEKKKFNSENAIRNLKRKQLQEEVEPKQQITKEGWEQIEKNYKLL